jgi:hypothetical protein
MKQIFLFLLTVLLLNAATGFAQDASGTCGENLTWALADGTLTISGTGAMTDYVGGTSPWYSYNNSIETVIVEDGVTSIGRSAFFDCISLVSITIPNSVTSIENMNFIYCTSLTAIDVHENNAAYASENGVLFNKEKTILIQYPAGKPDANYAVPNNVTNIREAAFLNCVNLISVIVGNRVTSIGSHAFSGSSNLTSVIIPNGVTSIETAYKLFSV